MNDKGTITQKPKSPFRKYPLKIPTLFKFIFIPPNKINYLNHLEKKIFSLYLCIP